MVIFVLATWFNNFNEVKMEDKRDIAVSVKNLKKYFFPHQNIIESITQSKKSTPVKAVDDVSFDIYKNEIFALIGESGSGKTTVAKLLMKLIPPTDGDIFFEGKSIVNISKEESAVYRRNTQMIFQDPYASMNPRFTVKNVLKEPLLIHKIKCTEKEAEEKIIKALDDVKIYPPHEFLERYPHMLSGGQRQRIATARTLILEPRFIIADEPVSMIDLSTRAEILHMMKEVQKTLNLSYLYITHDLSTARYFADRIAVMYLGHIVEIGHSDEIIDNAKHPYTKALIAAVPEPRTGNLHKIKELPIKGEIPSAKNIPQGCVFHTRCPYAKNNCSETLPGFVNITDTHKAACFYTDSLV